MSWQYTPYTLPLVFSTFVSFVLAVYAWINRETIGAKAFSLLMLGIAIWAGGEILVVSSVELASKVFWVKFQYIGIVIVPVSWLLFALQYAQKDRWLTRWKVIALFVIPIINLLLVWTMEYQSFYYREFGLDTSTSYVMFVQNPGIGYWACILFYNLVYALGIFVMFGLMLDSPRNQRAQTGVIIVGALIPWVADIVFQMGVDPIPGLDLAPFVFWITGLLTAWSLFHFHFLEITPIARELIIENLRDGMMVINSDNRIVDLNPAMEIFINRPADEVLGKTIEQAFVDRSDLAQHFGDIYDQVTEFTVEQNGKRFSYELHMSQIKKSQGQSIGHLVVLRNITTRRQAMAELERYADQNANLLAEELRQRELAESLRQTMMIISSSLERDAIIDEILNQLRRVLPYYSAALYLFDGDDLNLVRVVGPETITDKTYTTPRRDSQVAKIFKLKKAEVFLSAFSDQEETPKEPVYSSMAAPLVVGQEALGVLTIDRFEPQPFTQDNAEILQAFTNQAAIAFKNAEYFQQAKIAATIEERNRLAQDLHDAVNQTLFTASIMAEALPQVWERNPEQGRKGLIEIQQLTRGALAEMRTLLMELRPQSLTEKAIGDLLDHLTRAVSSRTRIPIDLDIENDTILPMEVQVAFYRIAQESLNNISKHAKASHVDILLDAQPDQATLTIQDNGCGFDVDQIPPGHFGLGIMAERAAQIGASLLVTSQINLGTEVFLDWQPEKGDYE